MIYLNYNNLDDETQQHLLSVSKEDIESKFGNDLKAYANEHHMDYDKILDEEAIKNLYTYTYVFKFTRANIQKLDVLNLLFYKNPIFWYQN